jgi:hypothetical protein
MRFAALLAWDGVADSVGDEPGRDLMWPARTPAPRTWTRKSGGQTLSSRKLSMGSLALARPHSLRRKERDRGGQDGHGAAFPQDSWRSPRDRPIHTYTGYFYHYHPRPRQTHYVALSFVLAIGRPPLQIRNSFCSFCAWHRPRLLRRSRGLQPNFRPNIKGLSGLLRARRMIDASRSRQCR